MSSPVAGDSPGASSPRVIDAHAHISADHPEAVELLRDLNLKLNNIAVALDSEGNWRQRRKTPEGLHPYQSLVRKYPDQCGWTTSFDLPRFNDPHYAERVIQEMDKDFQEGAVACKVWKNVGMAVVDPDGKFVMVDHPILEPIFQHLEKSGRTLIMHTGEPKACWEPLGGGGPHDAYYKKNPHWHFFGKKDVPSYEEILEARDRVVERHRSLRILGAHLGSMEYDVAQIAKRFDRFPNFAVDTSARLKNLALQDREKVREFFIRYADRILFGTDRLIRSIGKLSDEERKDTLSQLRTWYEGQFAYYSQDAMVGGLERAPQEHKVRGLGLPGKIAEKFFMKNARTWIPGL